MSKSTMTLFFFAILLLIWGYLCRLFSIYFFWDSKHFGWILLAIAFMGFFIDLRTSRMVQKKNIFWVRVGIAIIVLWFAAAGSVFYAIKTSDFYPGLFESIKKDSGIKSETGDIYGYSLIPTNLGILNMVSRNPSATASFVITVRGKMAYRDVKIILRRGGITGWYVDQIRSLSY